MSAEENNTTTSTNTSTKIEELQREDVEMKEAQKQLEQEAAAQNQQASAPSPKQLAEYAKAMGNNCFKQGNFKQAITYYSGAIYNDPTNHVYYSNRATCHFNLEQYSKAQEDAEKCISLNPTFDKAYFRLAKVFIAKSKLNEAYETLKNGMEKCPGSGELKKLHDEVEGKLREQFQQEALRKHTFNMVDKLKTLSGQIRCDLELRQLYNEAKARELCEKNVKTTNYDAIEKKIYPFVKPASLQYNNLSKEQLEKLKGKEEVMIFVDWKKQLKDIQKCIEEDEALKTVQKELGPSNFNSLLARIVFKYAKMELAEHFAKASLTHDKKNAESWIIQVYADMYQNGASPKSLINARKAINADINNHLAGALYMEVLDSLPAPEDPTQSRQIMQDLLALADAGSVSEPTAMEFGLRMWFHLCQTTFGAMQQMSEIIVQAVDSPECAALTLKIFNSFISPSQPLAKLCIEPFFVKALATVMMGRQDLEMLLTRVRAAILTIEPGKIIEDMQKFYYALALQQLQHAFAWFITEKEQNRLAEIIKLTESLLESAPSEGKWSLSSELQHYLLLISMYKPLNTLKCMEKLNRITKKELPYYFVQIINAHVQNVLKEQEYAATMKVVGAKRNQIKIDHQVTFPQWSQISTAIIQTPAHKEFEWFFPFFVAKNFENKKKEGETTRILFTHGSTGYGPCAAALKYENSQITAVDMDIKSVSFAKRQAKQLGITNVEFLHSENLAQVTVQEMNVQHQFDIIYGEDVLLSQDTQFEEAKSIVKNLLREGGIIRLSVSTGSQKDILRIVRQFLNSKMSTKLFDASTLALLRKPTHEEILQARKALNDSDDYQLKPIKNRFEWYNLHAFAEFVFGDYLQMVQYDFAGVEKLIQDLGLKFVAFTNLPKAFVKEYKEKYSADPNMKDFKALHKLATSNPELLGGASVYGFICEKPVTQTQASEAKKDPLNIRHWLNKMT